MERPAQAPCQQAWEDNQQRWAGTLEKNEWKQEIDAFMISWNLGAKSPPRQPPSARTRQGPTFQFLLKYHCSLLAPPGALVAIPTYYWPTTSTHFFRSHRSSILDFYFLSHYSYIKGIHWTHLLATCIPYGYNRTSLQDSARECKIVQDSARYCKIVQDSAR